MLLNSEFYLLTKKSSYIKSILWGQARAKRKRRRCSLNKTQFPPLYVISLFNSNPFEEDDQNGSSKYDEDVIDAANLAIAIQNEDFTTNIELFLHCENLPKMDLMSLSDPIILVYLEKDNERDRDKNNDKE